MSSNTQSKHFYLKDLHFEHKVWKNELSFNKEETTIYEHRLDELATRYTDKEVMARLEQFQNQFIREKEVIDELYHKIKINEDALAEYAEDHPIAIDHHHFQDHKELREQMNRFRELFLGLKEDFFKYLSKWM